ncbi:MAG TPA: alkaline phosphatase family protein [Dermatophilaceae bacterium]|nr:alkaline phosphatase family protein [Dermatophilaceae bacterium]
MSTLSAAQVSSRRESIVTALTSPDLASIVDLVVWVERDTDDLSADGLVAMAASHVGRVRLHLDGRHRVLAGLDPIASEDPLAFLPYDLECASPGPPISRENSYPYAASRILSLFGDQTRSPDVAVIHTPGHFFPEQGGHVGEHGSLDVIQSRAPLLLSGKGVATRGIVEEHARLVDVCPTLATMAGVPGADLRDAGGDPLDGRALTAYLGGEALAEPKVIGILWDGAHCGDLLHLAESGELPGIARLIANGVALRGGAVAQFPSVTLTNHTSILTGLGPGRHGVLGNVFYDRATGRRVVPNNAQTWHRSAEWLRPAVRTVFEMVNDGVPQGNSARTACVNEAVDRGADYSTMAMIRDSGSSSGAAGLDDQLPEARASVHVHDMAHLDDSYFSWCTQVDDLGLEQMRQLWATPELAPTLTWWANIVSDAGHHAGGPRSDIARDSLRDSDSRLVSFLAHLDELGITDQVTFLLTADHGFEGSDPTVTGSWQPALERLGIPFRDEGPGFIYLLPDPDQD